MLTIHEVCQATQGDLTQGRNNLRINGVSIDSRTIQKGNLFIAIKGDRLDGHKFINKAIKKGAKAVLVGKKMRLNANVAVIYVDDTTKALKQLAGYYRELFDIPIIAITGSAGKTSTKEITADVLARKYTVLRNKKSENNYIGVPLTLLALRKKHKAAVVEIGTNQPGDIASMAAIIRPTAALFTNIGDSHLARLKNKAGVLKEKSTLINFLSEDGTIIFNNDDPYLRKIKRKQARQKIITYGLKTPAVYRASDVRWATDGKARFTVRKKSYILPAPADHFIYNALAAICCAELLGVGYNSVREALKASRAAVGRFEQKKMAGVTVIDDSYNANPVSMRSAVNALDKMACSGRKFLVCGDMLELGSKGKALHQEIGRLAGKAAIDYILTYGKQAKYLSQSAQARTAKTVRHFTDQKRLGKYLKQAIVSGDVLLVKGSRGMRMEKIIQLLDGKGVKA